MAGLWLTFLTALSTMAISAEEPRRLALLIGNQNYTRAVGPLEFPRSDIEVVGEALVRLGFKVTSVSDVGKVEMDDAMQRFADEVRRAGPGAISFFYYSGHGAVNPENNVNYLVPIDVSDVSTDALWYRSMPQQTIIDLLSQWAGNATHFVVFDACRNELKFSGARSKGLGADKGFVPVGEVPGMLIAYSTAAKRAAADTGRFARILAEELPKKVEAVSMFRGIQIRVQQTMRQEPWMSLSYLPQTYLAGRDVAAVDPQIDEARREDELAWAKASASNTLEGFRLYASRQKGEHLHEAREAIVRLEALKEHWARLANGRDLLNLKAFVEAAKNTEFESLAALQVYNLEAAEKAAWEQVLRQKLLADYEAFLKTWPNGSFAAEAKARIERLKAIKAEWERLRDKNDKKVLETFISQYGWTEWGPEATAHLVALPGPQDEKKLAAAELAQLLDGRTLIFRDSGQTISFSSKLEPSYRTRLGKDFMKRQFEQDFSAEGAFHADAKIDGRTSRIEGLAGIRQHSKEDPTGSLFLMQMYGAEKSLRDVNVKNRAYAAFQIVKGPHGYVCIGTTWESILSRKEPKKISERCEIKD